MRSLDWPEFYSGKKYLLKKKICVFNIQKVQHDLMLSCDMLPVQMENTPILRL